MKQNLAGFSLLELSIVLVIMGITATGLMSMATQSALIDKTEITQKRMAIIEKRLALYVKENQRLPCPANGSLAMTDPAFGKEQATNNGNLAQDFCTNGYGQSGNVWAGAVPTRILDLSDEMALDGWGRRFTYSVDDRFTNNQLGYTACGIGAIIECFEFMATGAIRVNTSIAGTARSTGVVYVLISHGNNGHGAFPRNGGTRINVSTDAAEEENAHALTGAIYNATYIDQENSATYDDIVHYKQKYQIIGDIHPPITESICEMAKNVVLTPTDNICSGLVGTNLTDCQDYAGEVESICAGLYN